MLYISRVVFKKGAGAVDFHHLIPQLTRRPCMDMLYGVADSDDDAEDLVTLYDLCNICCHIGLPVRGVEVKEGQIEVIKPYQSLETMTQLQRKAHALYGVEITEYCGAISSITYDGTSMKTAPVIRLSDICHWCGDFLFLNTDYCGAHAITLVIDNKLSFTPKSFMGYLSYSPGLSGLGVVFDLRELLWDDKAQVIYDLLYSWSGSSMIQESILDIPERRARFVAKLRREGRIW